MGRKAKRKGNNTGRGYEGTETCPWQINGFPRALKNRYLAICKANNRTVLDVTEYLIARYLKELGVDIPPLRRDNGFVFEQLNLRRDSENGNEKKG